MRDLLVSVCLFCGGKHVKSYRDKAVSVRPSKGEHRKSLLVFMSHMIIDSCQKFHGFTAVPCNDRIIQDQDFNPLRTCQGTESSRYFSSEEQNELFPVKRNFIQETIVSIL